MAVRGRSGWAPSVTLTMGRRSSSLLLLVVAIGAVLVCAADGESGRRGRRLKKRENAIWGNQNGERDRESFTRNGGYLCKKYRWIFLTNCEIAPGGGSNPRPIAIFQSFGINISYTSNRPP